jgi:hypothetical protein
MSIRQRVTANYNKRHKWVGRIRPESRDFNERVETTTDPAHDLPVQCEPEPITELMLEPPAREIRIAPVDPRPAKRREPDGDARLLEARARAEHVLKEHLEYDEYGSTRCVQCGFVFPCDAVRAAEDLLHFALPSRDEEPAEFAATPN